MSLPLLQQLSLSHPKACFGVSAPSLFSPFLRHPLEIVSPSAQLLQLTPPKLLRLALVCLWLQTHRAGSTVPSGHQLHMSVMPRAADGAKCCPTPKHFASSAHDMSLHHFCQRMSSSGLLLPLLLSQCFPHVLLCSIIPRLMLGSGGRATASANFSGMFSECPKGKKKKKIKKPSSHPSPVGLPREHHLYVPAGKCFFHFPASAQHPPC